MLSLFRPGPGSDCVPRSPEPNPACTPGQARRQDSEEATAAIISDGFGIGSTVSLKRAVETALRAELMVCAVQCLDSDFVTYVYPDPRDAGEAALRQMATAFGHAGWLRRPREIPT